MALYFHPVGSFNDIQIQYCPALQEIALMTDRTIQITSPQQLDERFDAIPQATPYEDNGVLCMVREFLVKEIGELVPNPVEEFKKILDHDMLNDMGARLEFPYEMEEHYGLVCHPEDDTSDQGLIEGFKRMTHHNQSLLIIAMWYSIEEYNKELENN